MNWLHKQKKIIIGIALALVLIVGYFGITRYLSTHAVPGEFRTARAEGGQYAQEITDLSKEVRDDLVIVREREQKGQFKEAAELLVGVKERNNTMKDNALELAKRLTAMAQSTQDIRSEEAQPIALDALAIHLKMIQRTINYNKYLTELTGLLEKRFQGQAVDQKRIAQLIQQINDEVDAVNDLNGQATRKLEKFDETIRESQ